MDINEYLGHSAQLYGITPFAFTQGKANGIKAFDVRNGNGLEMNILESRCLDISRLTYKGINLSYLSKSGITAPEYYDSREYEFLQGFYAGFLTTCGLKNIGAPCIANGESFGLHGKISNTPAEETSAYIDYSKQIPVIRIGGIVRESRIFKENMVLKREFEIPIGKNSFTIKNTVTNIGFKPEPFMIMFHINFGYPLLDEYAKLYIPSLQVEPRDEIADKGLSEYLLIKAPCDNYPEQVFFHSFRQNGKHQTPNSNDKARNSNNKTQSENQETRVALINHKLKIGIALRYNTDSFPFTTQWKQFQKGDYVLGIEPSSCKMIGRAALEREKLLDYLQPHESKTFNIEVEILDGTKDINKFLNEFKNL